VQFPFAAFPQALFFKFIDAKPQKKSSGGETELDHGDVVLASRVRYTIYVIAVHDLVCRLPICNKIL